MDNAQAGPLRACRDYVAGMFINDGDDKVRWRRDGDDSWSLQILSSEDMGGSW